METVSLEQKQFCHIWSYSLCTTLLSSPPSISCLSNQQAATVTGRIAVASQGVIPSHRVDLRVSYGIQVTRRRVHMGTHGGAIHKAGVTFYATTDATCTGVLMLL